MPINYPRNFRGGRTNRGFKDVRGQPEEAFRVKEAISSPMLRELLVAAARPEARFFTIGRDLGGHREEEMTRSEVSGGYIQVALQDYACARAEQYREEAERIETGLRSASKGYRWRIVMQLHHGCIFRLRMDPEAEAPTLSIYFWARGSDVATALMSREALLAGLKAVMFPIPE